MFRETDLGFELKNSEMIVFFGKKNCTFEDLKKGYPNLIFRQVKQTHSDICVQSEENQSNTEADAHYTFDKNVALLIKTADCLPILVQAKNAVLAVHAGWRGVENKITQKSLWSLKAAELKNIFIGPHIMQKSFEVDSSVKDLLEKSAVESVNLSFEKNNKHYVDLQKIVKSQVRAISQVEIHTLNQDTYQNSMFNSFRTDKTTHRNLSFIAQF
jgi:YfiH family protein